MLQGGFELPWRAGGGPASGRSGCGGVIGARARWRGATSGTATSATRGCAGALDVPNASGLTPSPARFRGGLVFKAHRLFVSLNSRLESNKEEEEACEVPQINVWKLTRFSAGSGEFASVQG